MKLYLRIRDELAHTIYTKSRSPTYQLQLYLKDYAPTLNQTRVISFQSQASQTVRVLSKNWVSVENSALLNFVSSKRLSYAPYYHMTQK